MTKFEPVAAPNAPYKSYALYLRPDGDTAVLSADAEDQRLYHNKGFEFLGFTRAPGQTADPIDWRPWPVTTDGHVLPWNAGPVVPNLPNVTREQTRSMGGDPEMAGVEVDMPLLAQGGGGARSASQVNRAADQGQDPLEEARRKLRERGVPEERHEAILRQISTGQRRSMGEVADSIRRSSALPGLVAEKGVTRGIPGVDPTMPSPIPGIPFTDREGMRQAEERGELERRELEVGDGMVVEQLVASEGERRRQGVSGPTDAPGDAGAGRQGASTPNAPDPQGPAADVTVRDQGRHQQVREEAMRAEGQAEGRTVGTETTEEPKPPASQNKTGASGSTRRR
jgi:hypothetical protein